MTGAPTPPALKVIGRKETRPSVKIEDNIQGHRPGPEAARTTAQLRAEHKRETSRSQHAVDHLTSIVGLPGFAAVLTISIILWVSANVVAKLLGIWVVDPPPFVWLQDAVTTGALYVAILILTTQRREEQLSLPIRLTPIPTTFSVLPIPRV
jgi:uncharacterized membrane protein